MVLFYWAMFGGLVGTVMMDITGWLAGQVEDTLGGMRRKRGHRSMAPRLSP